MNSKYFSSVINKLLALKKKEDIVPDEALRERLREGLLARAAEMKQPRGVRFDGFDAGAVKEFLYKFRYAFGVVPVALVVVLVAVQISQLPFEVTDGRNEVVDGEVGDEVLDEGAASLIQAEEVQDDTVEGEQVMNMNVSDDNAAMVVVEELPMESVTEAEAPAPLQEKKIQTFAGESVLPSNFRRKNEVPQEGMGVGIGGGVDSDAALEGEVYADTPSAAMPTSDPCASDEDGKTQESEQTQEPGCSP